MIAALYVAAGGSYSNLDDVDPWGEERDARLYSGPWTVVAHPPCARWCRLAALVESCHPHLKRGEDDGCFEAALEAVRKWGGVLEHPAFSDAFTAYGLPIPPTTGGWQGGICGGWSCYVEQGRYGHPAKKATWLYTYGVDFLPPMRWGRCDEPKSWVGFCDDKPTIDRHRRVLVSGAQWPTGGGRRRLGPKEASATPELFRDELLGIARGARPRVRLRLTA